jgi:plastocyanin
MRRPGLRAVAVLVTAIVLGLAAAGCAPAERSEAVATDQVDLPPSYRFEPEVITVPDGTEVTWTNHDNFTHNVRLLDDGGAVMTIEPGASVSFTFSGPGEHRYDCSFHPNDMSGVVVVTEG